MKIYFNCIYRGNILSLCISTYFVQLHRKNIFVAYFDKILSRYVMKTYFVKCIFLKKMRKVGVNLAKPGGNSKALQNIWNLGFSYCTIHISPTPIILLHSFLLCFLTPFSCVFLLAELLLPCCGWFHQSVLLQWFVRSSH